MNRSNGIVVLGPLFGLALRHLCLLHEWAAFALVATLGCFSYSLRVANRSGIVIAIGPAGSLVTGVQGKVM